MKERYGRGRHLLRRLALAAGIATATVVPSVEAGITTAQIFSTTFKQLSDCLDYRILGLSLRVIWTPYGPYYFWTLHVGRTVPAMVNQSHPYRGRTTAISSVALTKRQVRLSSALLFRPFPYRKRVPGAIAITNSANTMHRSTTSRHSSVIRR